MNSLLNPRVSVLYAVIASVMKVLLVAAMMVAVIDGQDFLSMLSELKCDGDQITNVAMCLGQIMAVADDAGKRACLFVFWHVAASHLILSHCLLLH